VGKPLCWTQEQDEVTVFRESACRQRYLERQERLRSIEAGGVPIQRSEVEVPTHSRTRASLSLDCWSSG
jgi:hypothetical protein